MTCPVLKALQASSRINSMLKGSNFVKNHSSKEESGPIDGVSHRECSDTGFVAISKISVE